MREATLPVATLIRDDRLRFRDHLHRMDALHERYAEVMQDARGWGEFPPLTCVELTAPFAWELEVPDPRVPSRGRIVRHRYEAGTVLLVGGFTRCEAADLAAVATAPCRVHPGTWADALKLAWAENASHGKPRSSAEVQAVLDSIHLDPALAALGRREVARIARTSEGMVQRYRNRQREREQAAADEVARLARQGGVDPDRPVDEPTVVDNTTPGATGGARIADPRAAASGPSAGATVRRDAWGRPLPPSLEAAWDCVAPAARELRAIRSAAMSLAALKHGPDGSAECLPAAIGLERADVRGAAAAILTGLEMVESALPFVVCPSCRAARNLCHLCEATGYVTREQALSLPPDLERVAKQFQGVQ